ncbi:hypothetical protein [Chryseobacterium shandongense]|uniref:Uncharacterized protein n=1 Tax=Chryseobacterium shandongense TaxID=1493872 RepID=A0ABN5RY08_9FLAO|nr:hypothetical protein [Chryseobacterium shandongense]AZA95612.1 hypothetical protein EG353_08555 [Chryseobacterium shandongense]
MKTVKTAIAALLIAGGTIGAFAFTKSDKTETRTLSAQTELHWFDPSGTYIGTGTVTEIEALCPGDGTLCAKGYDGENNGAPVGPERYRATRN